MNKIKLISLCLVCVMLASVFCLFASAEEKVTVNFIPKHENGIIYGIALKTPQNVFRALYSGRTIEIFDNDGKRLAADDTTYMGTGFTVKLDGRYRYSVVVMGDIDGDGELTPRDYILIKRTVLGTYSVSNVAKEASGMEHNGELRPINYIKVKRAYFKTYDINKKYTCDPYDPYAGDDGWSGIWV